MTLRGFLFLVLLCFMWCGNKGSLIVSSSPFPSPFFLAPHKKEAKKLSGSTYVFGVRSRSYVSLAVVSQINVPSRHDRASKLTLFVRSNS